MTRLLVRLCLLCLPVLLVACGRAPLASSTSGAPPTVAPSVAGPTRQFVDEPPPGNPSDPPTAEPAAPPTVPPTASPSPAPTPTAGTGAAAGALPHYRLQADLDYYGHTVSARQHTTVTNDSARPWTELVFNASAAYWPGRFELQEATLAHAGESAPAPLRWQSTMLHIALDPALQPGQTTEVTFVFHLNLPRLDPVGWAPDGNSGWGPGVAQVGDWHPALVPYQEDGGWQTWEYHPVGDPVRSRLGDYDLEVTAPPEVTVVAPGLVQREGGEHHFHLPAARAVAFLASPDYVRLQDESGSVPVRVYVLPDHAESAPVVLETARQALELFAAYYGPYPYEELVIAQNGFLTAMEYSALISLSGFAFDSYKGSPDALLVAITAHEVAHQWFYSSVGSDQVEAPWLDESLAMVSEWLFYEAHYPALVDWWWQFRVDRWQPQGPVDVAVYDYADSPTFVHNMYGRAAHFMRDLRLLLGEEAFAACLRDYYRRHRQGWATEDDFFAAALPYTTPQALRDLAARYFNALPPSLTSAPPGPGAGE